MQFFKRGTKSKSVSEDKPTSAKAADTEQQPNMVHTFNSDILGTFIRTITDGVEGEPERYYPPLTGDKPRPVEIKIWHHSYSYPDHFHHLALHGKAVMTDQKFTIRAPNGKSYKALGPHDPSLPQKERNECRCSASPFIIFLNASEETKMRDEMAATGGMLNELWAEKAEESKQRSIEYRMKRNPEGTMKAIAAWEREADKYR